MNKVTITARSLDGLRKATARLAAQIGATGSLLPTFGSSIDGAHPHIEVDSEGLHFVVVERGREIKRKTTSDPNELAYWIFESITFCMASDFECKNRIGGQDSRRILFSTQEELLGQLDSSWQERQRSRHESILAEHPFDDEASLRAECCAQLRDSGMTAAAAWSLACKKYPLEEGKKQNNHKRD